MIKVLFIDDEPDLWIGRFRAMQSDHGLCFEVEADPERAVERVASEKPDVVLLDSVFQNSGGQALARGPELLARISGRFPEVPVVMFTATLGQNGVEETDFPQACRLFYKDRFADANCDPDAELADMLLEAARATRDRRSLDERLGFVVGKTPAMLLAAEAIIRFAPQGAPVLIYGETGTGKGLVAKALHAEGGRKGALVPIDCGRHRGDVLEDQLFGHEANAFTGAKSLHHGFFEQANHGSLFLDEIHAMSGELQDKLLLAVEDRWIRRIGGKGEIPVDVRVISASNQPLPKLVRKGLFRDDLYARLEAYKIYLPPLRERMADLPALFRTLVTRLNLELNRKISAEARDDVIDKLASFNWPRNIRQLEGVLRHAMTTARANVLTPNTIVLPNDGQFDDSVGSEPDRSEGAGFDLAERILAGEAGWEEFKQIRGPYRRAIVVELIQLLARTLGREPGSKDLAQLLDTNDNNLRQVLGELGGLRALRQSVKAGALEGDSHG